MIEYLFLIISIPAAIHSYTFAKVLRQEGNIPGTLFVIALAAICMGFSAYRVVTAP